MIVGATAFEDPGAVADFRGRTDATYPMLRGVTEDTRKAFEVSGYPALRIIGKKGGIAGRSMDDLRALLGG